MIKQRSIKIKSEFSCAKHAMSKSMHTLKYVDSVQPVRYKVNAIELVVIATRVYAIWAKRKAGGRRVNERNGIANHTSNCRTSSS